MASAGSRPGLLWDIGFVRGGDVLPLQLEPVRVVKDTGRVVQEVLEHLSTLTDAGYDADFGAGLPGYTSVDVTASRALGRMFEVFVGAQNVFDTEYFVQTNPSTIGTPRLVHGGLRVRFGR